MLTLCIDTSYKYLTCALIKDEELLGFESYECFKKQSEEVFACLNTLFNKTNINRKAIDSICISEGPGSYTGVRIAMSIAKTIGTLLNIDVYTISTLRLYANNQENTMVIMDARANRAYVGIYNKEEIIKDDYAIEIDKINYDNYNLVGDLNLLNKQDKMYNIAKCFLNTKNVWKKIENIAYLVPKYLKESESYYR